MTDEVDFAALRTRMVMEQLEGRGIRNTAVLQAMLTVPREQFVPAPYSPYAYDDTPLPILADQTISQPYVVAWMISLLALRPMDRVLEIGTGSGYSAAVLSQIVQEVYTVERHETLVKYARQRLTDLGYENIYLSCGDGTLGWPEYAPYDAILVSAGGPMVPPTLKEQLAINGRLVMPVGRHKRKQKLLLLTRQSQDRFTTKQMGPVAFVPLIGVEGWIDKSVPF